MKKLPVDNKVIQESHEVSYFMGDIVHIAQTDLIWLKEQANSSKENKARICTHQNKNSLVHEMIIAHKKGNFIPPHRHPKRIESLSVIEGEAIFFTFSEAGEIIQSIAVSADEGIKYIRINHDFYHTLLIKSDYFIYHEVTQGPFNDSSIQISDWSPNINDDDAIDSFLKQLASY